MSGGIFGVIDLDGAAVDPGSLGQLRAGLQHRDRGGRLSSASRSIHVGDLGGESSTWHDDRAICVAHGRIDNRSELGRKLGIDVRDLSAAALIHAVLDAWGETAAAQLRGDFAFVHSLLPSGRVLAGRDMQGMKPLVVRQQGSLLHFASEVGPLCSGRFTASINTGFVAEHLTGMARSRTETVWSEVDRVRPGTTWRYDSRSHREITNWDAEALLCEADESRHRDLSTSEWDDRLVSIIETAVQSRLSTDGGTSIEMSGGMDSTTVLAQAVALQREGQATAPITALVRDYASAGVDDAAYAREAIAELGVESRVTAADPLAAHQALAATRAHIDQTRDLALPALLGSEWSSELSWMSATGIDVALSGQGGDERLGPTHHLAIDLARRGRLGAAKQVASQALPEDADHRAVQRLLGRLVFEAFRPSWLRRPSNDAPFTANMPWLHPDLAPAVALDDRIAPARAGWGESHAKQQLIEWATTQASNDVFEVAERAAATFGVSYRHPFEDQALVEWMICVPESVRTDPGDGRAAHRRALGSLLPAAIGRRRTKGDFSPVIATILRAQRVFSTDRTAALVDAGFLDRGWMEQAVARLYQGDDSVAPSLQTLAVVEMWLERGNTVRW